MGYIGGGQNHTYKYTRRKLKVWPQVLREGVIVKWGLNDFYNAYVDSEFYVDTDKIKMMNESEESKDEESKDEERESKDEEKWL